jgi:outer membrane protein assembly factor BamB
MATVLSRCAGTLVAVALALALATWVPASARADWTTYRGDAARSGVDSSSTGSLPFAAAWTSPSLGGNVWAEPLVYRGLVIVATEANQVSALNEATGQVVWQASAGTPVPSGKLKCGDISPTVGITSTPVIDPATSRVFVVADTWDGTNSSSIIHKLFAFNLSDGSAVAGFPVSVEPPGDVPADQLQRPALALDGGKIVVGYGGNDGDCGTYHGWLVAAAATGGPQQTFEVESQPNATEGAIWGAGNGPAVDASGDVWAATGNGNSGSTYGYQESVLKLDQGLNLVDHWAPSNWLSLDNGDTDLGSSDPLLLPNGLVFQIGKQGVGYLLSASNLRGTGASPLYQAQVCGGSYGGAVYYQGVIYVTCSDGLRALTLNPSTPSFSPLPGWQVTSSAIGPPIVAGGLVWVTDWGHATLYGLNLQTGHAAVRQSTPSMEHFAIPSASDGKLFLATGQTVEAYTIASPATPAPVSPPPSGTPSPGSCVLRLRSHRVKIHARKALKHGRKALPDIGAVTLIAKCSQGATVTLSGSVTEQLGKKPKHGKQKSRTFHLAKVHATLKAGVSRTLRMRIPAFLLLALQHVTRESVAFTLTATNANGATRARAHARLKL